MVRYVGLGLFAVILSGCAVAGKVEDKVLAVERKAVNAYCSAPAPVRMDMRAKSDASTKPHKVRITCAQLGN